MFTLWSPVSSLKLTFSVLLKISLSNSPMHFFSFVINTTDF